MLRRNIEEKLKKYLHIFPVVLLTGARQTGKTTFVKEFAKTHKFSYVTFDDTSILLAAKEDPSGFLNRFETPIIIDEVQRVPEIFLAIKQLVDQKELKGQFLLTGSANPLLIPKTGDSLAGRMGILNLYPFSQGELKEKRETFLPWLFAKEFKIKSFPELSLSSLGNMIYRGGFPRVLDLHSSFEIESWIQSYLQILMDRDVRDLSQVAGLYHFPSLLNLIAGRSGSLFNASDIARTLNISLPSVTRYLTLLETIFLVFREPAWFSNLSKRISKSPKIYLCDTGVLSYLLKMDQTAFQTHPSQFGFLLESFIVSELLKQASFVEEKISQHHFREGTHEVDIVLEERGGNIIGIEIKKSETIRPSDFDGLKRLQSIAKQKFIRGIILYSGNTMIPYGDQLWAVPISSLWQTKES